MSKLDVMALLEGFAARQLTMRDAADQIEALYMPKPETDDHPQAEGATAMSTLIEARLDEIITAHRKLILSATLDVRKGRAVQKIDFADREAEQDILDLFAHLASEAKPNKAEFKGQPKDFTKIVEVSIVAHNQAVDTYHNNILKALGRE